PSRCGENPKSPSLSEIGLQSRFWCLQVDRAGGAICPVRCKQVQPFNDESELKCFEKSPLVSLICPDASRAPRPDRSRDDWDAARTGARQSDPLITGGQRHP